MILSCGPCAITSRRLSFGDAPTRGVTTADSVRESRKMAFRSITFAKRLTGYTASAEYLNFLCKCIDVNQERFQAGHFGDSLAPSSDLLGNKDRLYASLDKPKLLAFVADVMVEHRIVHQPMGTSGNFVCIISLNRGLTDGQRHAPRSGQRAMKDISFTCH
jgi:hypothetical protein